MEAVVGRRNLELPNGGRYYIYCTTSMGEKFDLSYEQKFFSADERIVFCHASAMPRKILKNAWQVRLHSRAGHPGFGDYRECQIEASSRRRVIEHAQIIGAGRNYDHSQQEYRSLFRICDL